MGTLPQLGVGETNDGLVLERLVQHVAAHHLPENAQDVPQVVHQLLAAALGDLNLIQHHQGLEAVQLAAEMDAGVILGHQHVAEQLGHMLRLFHVVGAGLIVHVLGLGRLRGAHHGRDDRLGGRGGRGGRLRRLPPCGHFDFALLKIFPRRGRQYFPLRDVVDLGLGVPQLHPEEIFCNCLHALHPFLWLMGHGLRPYLTSPGRAGWTPPRCGGGE